MKRRIRSRRAAGTSTPDPAAGLRDSAQKIWLAGLGALERARTDGPRAFESLVEQGRNMGARAVGAADEALKAMRQADYSGNHWQKLEQAFEERVSRSLGKLGVLTGKEVEALSREVRELSESMRRLMGGAAPAKAGSARRAKAAAKPRKARAVPRAGAKKAAPRKSRKASRAPRAKP